MNAPADNSFPSVAILAGGLATRLRPITTTIPKSMVPVSGEPFIAHQLRLLASQDITNIVLCCGYLGDQIREFVGDGSQFGCSVRYSFDGEQLKGTGGAILRALHLLSDPFILMYGDSYLPEPIRPIYDHFKLSNYPALMAVFRNGNRWDKSNIELDDGKIVFYDKKQQTPAMEYIDYGLGILSASCFAPWQNQRIFDLALLYEGLVKMELLAGYVVQERFYEIGSYEGLEETTALLGKISSMKKTTDAPENRL